MNKISTKLMVAIVCGSVCLSTVAGVAMAKNTTEKNIEIKQEPVTLTQTANETEELTKDETVYVFTGADGTVDKIVVSDWIKNALLSSTISDKTDLTDIENLKGDESFTINDNVTLWDAQGNDIYYQGSIEKQLPVNLSISYKLDGSTISANQLAGKSGKVTIRFDYKNNQYKTVEINGQDEKIYVPFVMLTGMILDTDTFRNVEVSNGKIVNDGAKTVVIGFGLPGLQENLNLTKDQIDIPDYVEITADVTDFEFGMTLTVATNELFNNLDYDNIDSVDGLTDSLGQLTDGMRQLLDGSSALYGGLSTLLDKSQDLVTGINQLADGALLLKDGTGSLNDGAAQLSNGAAELSAGLNTLKSNNDALNGGAKQVFETLLGTATTQINDGGIAVPALTIDNYAAVLNGVIESLDETAVYNTALAQVTAAVENNRDLIKEKVTEAVREQVEPQVIAAVKQQVEAGVQAAVKEQVRAQVINSAAGMSAEEYNAALGAGMIDEQTQAMINAAIEQQMQTEEVQALTLANVNAKMESEEIQATIQASTDAQIATDALQSTINDNVELQVQQLISENMASDEVQAKLAAASEGAKSIISLKTSLDSFNAFYLGLQSYTNGVAQAADGAVALASGASALTDGVVQIKDGASALYGGIVQLKDGAPALIDGISKLNDGSMQLNDGLKKFNEQGIQKIVDLVDGDLDDIVSRLKATIDVSKDYCNFSGINEDMDGQVRFIYRTQEIKAE